MSIGRGEMGEAEERLREALPRLARLGAVVCLDLGPEGCWRIDARTAAPVMVLDDDDAPGGDDVACSIRLTPDNLLKLMDGRLDPLLGYSMGKIKVSGSKGVAMKLVGVLA
ncbi:SCP2 sterol-binding domain-containing protein [Pararhodospirillum photometricum]|nr:SCP2 sterol-binding domain-containing protein [Pararhodospirillum photometricum]